MGRRSIGRRQVADAASLWELLNLGAPEETAWMVDALCAQTDPEAFFPDKGESTRPAKAVCLACPVRPACLAYALEHREPHGVWGGLSPRERRSLPGRAIATSGEVAA